MNDDDEFIIPELSSWAEHLREQEEQDPFCGYILENGKIKQVSWMEWAKWFGNHEKRRVDLTEFKEIGVRVSTVFLGIDHVFFPVNYGIKKAPVLFETMVFGGELDEFQWRYCTYGEAKRGHWEVVNAIKENRTPEITEGGMGFWGWFKEMFGEENSS